MRLINTTCGDLGLDPATVVPAQGALEIEAAAFARHKGNPIIAHWLATGALVADEPSPPQQAKPAKPAAKGV